MSLGHESVVPEVRPGTARVQVTELSGSGNINPTPNPNKPTDESAMDLYLSPERLKRLCGTRDLSVVTSLEVCIDTQENTLGSFGAYLPRLVQLKMNNSSIISVRDLGTTLSHLQVLWMSRCCLQDLDGISTFLSLKELYLAYNYLSDLSHISMLENLQLLDLEGNDVDDLVQVQYLGLCLKLQTLTLAGNPVCERPNSATSKVEDYSYRKAVRELVPQLRYLDDLRVEEDRLTCCSITGEDWDILRNFIRDHNSSEAAKETADSVCPYSTHSATSRPFSSPSGVRPLSSPGSRLMSATSPGGLSHPGSRPGSSDFDLGTVEVETSSLIDGAGKILFCGNPVQAVRARREKLKTAPTRSTLTSRDLPIHVPEHTYDLEEPYLGERVNVFAELRAWRKQHSRCLEIIEKERLPQILAIHHDAEDESYGEEEECFDCVKNNSSDEELGEEKHSDGLETGSPGSSFKSLSSGAFSLSTNLTQQEAFSSEMTQLSVSPDTRHSGSPPVCADSAPANKKLPGIRARRFRLSQATSEHSPNFSREGRTPQTMTPAKETNLVFERVHAPPMTSDTHRPRPPSRSVLQGGPMNSCVDQSDVQPDHKHNVSKILNKPAMSRPHTARAVLQKHSQHHLLQPYRGSSHPD